MSQHTPGPWRVADDIVFQVRAHDDQMLVAEIRGWGWLTGGGGLALRPDDAEQIQRANARLIAAAPDLLEALRGLLAVSGLRTGAPEHELMAHRAARAAIEKATGRKP